MRIATLSARTVERREASVPRQGTHGASQAPGMPNGCLALRLLARPQDPLVAFGRKPKRWSSACYCWFTQCAGRAARTPRTWTTQERKTMNRRGRSVRRYTASENLSEAQLLPRLDLSQVGRRPWKRRSPLRRAYRRSYQLALELTCAVSLQPATA
jgi:hypothetical protein